MEAWLSMRTPSATPSPPIQLASTGLRAVCAANTNCLAVSAGSVIACGATMARRPSVLGSASALCTARAKRSGGASPSTSTGFAWLQCDGRNESKWLIVSGASSGKVAPANTAASVAKTAGPPAFVTMASRGPRGRGCISRASERSNSSAIESTRNTPHRRNTASSTSSCPVSAPVCDAAALAAA